MPKWPSKFRDNFPQVDQNKPGAYFSQIIMDPSKLFMLFSIVFYFVQNYLEERRRHAQVVPLFIDQEDENPYAYMDGRQCVPEFAVVNRFLYERPINTEDD